jgi:hypothetical protein
VWLRRPALTTALAGGGDPDASPELVRLAHELIGARNKRRLAHAVDRVLRDAAEPPRPWRAAIPLNRREIMAARDELAALAERLRAPAPVPVHAMALTDRLLSDGNSPIYHREAEHSLRLLTRAARSRLDDPIA